MLNQVISKNDEIQILRVKVPEYCPFLYLTRIHPKRYFQLLNKNFEDLRIFRCVDIEPVRGS